MTFRRIGTSALLACCMAVGAVSCSSSSDSSSGSTNIEDLGPQIRQLQSEVGLLRRQVQQLELQLRISGVTTTSTTRPLR
jgi:hypothetical protein